MKHLLIIFFLGGRYLLGLGIYKLKKWTELPIPQPCPYLLLSE